MKKLSQQFLLYFLPIFAIEFLFRFQAYQLGLDIYLLRSIIHTAFLATILLLINGFWHNKLISVITVFIFTLISFYAFFQIGIQHYYGMFFSVKFIMKGMPDVGSYAFDFIKYLKPQMILYIIVWLLSLIAYFKLRATSAYLQSMKQRLALLALTFAIYISFLSSLVFLDPKGLFESSIKLYKNPTYSEIATKQLGITAFMLSDFQYFLFPNRATIEETIEPVNPNPDGNNGLNPENPNIRKFDDQPWITIKDNETNDKLKAIDQYFLNKPINPKNEKTGIYKDKNFVYVLVEAFDLIAIHPELTPTLYKMKTEGSYFDHFYSPQYNCATAESELVSVTSTYPVIGTCTMSAYYENASFQSVYKLFKNSGYQTSSYHNWNDQFYPRTKIHPVLGSDKYLDEPDLIPRRIKGWQSDLTMMEGVVKDLNKREGNPFMAYVITSSTHLPYDIPSNLGQKYVKQVKKVYPDAPYEIETYISKAIELDKSMEYLLKNLDDIDNTVIMLFADHRPLKMPAKYLNQYSDGKRNKAYELDRTPMMIYNSKQTPEVNSKYASTIDMLPTVANLFDLNHDPRLFMGVDLNGTEEPIVIFQSGSWYDQTGYFDVKTSSFTPFNKDITLTDDEIKIKNQKVKQKLSVSSNIYTEGYYKKRLELVKTK